MSIEKALNDALKLIEKDFGKGSIMRLERCRNKRQVLSSGSLALDIAGMVGIQDSDHRKYGQDLLVKQPLPSMRP